MGPLLTGRISSRSNYRKTITIVAIVSIIAGTWLFLKIANLVMEHKMTGLDQFVLHALGQADTSSQLVRPAWLSNSIRDITALGGYTVLTVLTVLVSLYLGLQHKLYLMVLSLVTIIGGAVASSTLKIIFARERPDIEHLVEVTTKSFPSGHAMLSTVFYLTLAILLIRTTSRNSIKLFYLSSAMLISLLVGASRVYLGVHFPTDILAGWIAGSVWVMSCFLVADYIRGYND